MKLSKRLIEQFVPENYEIEINPNIDKLTFEGQLQIKGKLVKASSEVMLHGKNITINSAKIDNNTASVNYDSENEELTLKFKSELPSDKEILIDIEYSGKIGQSNTGLYISVYEEEGVERKMLATQLEPANARAVLPCIDEPAAKATVQLSVIASSNMNVISNTLEESSKTVGDKTRTTFKPTPKMSTYLFAVIIGYMEYQEIKTADGVIIRTYGVKEDVKHSKFALDTAKQVVEWYNDFFGTPYPLENLNMVGMPDFEAGVGAMENWGCITYRADSLFVNPEMTSLPMKQYCGIVIAHEIAHQWFGNLVTMQWWDDLWLNEGFATWAEYMVATEIFPEWNLWSDFLSNDFVRAMQLDSRSQSHPIVAKIDNVKQVAGAFDAITYRKGASAIRMLAEYLGQETFKEGIQQYIKKFAYSNATTDDLWSSLSEASGKDVKTFMHSWTDIEGHPIVSIEGDTITQNRFVYNPKTKLSNDSTWLIPLKSSSGIDITLEEKNTKLDDNIDTNAIFNVGQSGFYRIKYSQEMLSYFNTNYDQIDEVDRIGFFFDVFDQTEAAYLDIVDSLPLLDLLEKEQSSHVWDSAMTGLGGIHNLFFNDENKSDFLKSSLNWIEPQLNRLGFTEEDNEPASNTLIRPQIIGIASKYDHKPTVKKLISLYDEIIKNGVNSVNTDLRGIVYATAAKNNHATFDQLLGMHQSTSHSEEQRRIAGAICTFEDSETGIKARKLITDGIVKVQDAYVWILRLYLNKHQRSATWQWVEDNWGWLEEHYAGSPLFNDFLRRFADKITSDEELEKIVGFIESKEMPELNLAIKQMKDIAETNIEWERRDTEKLKKYFKSL